MMALERTVPFTYVRERLLANTQKKNVQKLANLELNLLSSERLSRMPLDV